MKKFLTFVILALLVFSFTLVSSAQNSDRVCDFAGLLTESEEAEVRAKLDYLSEENQLELVALTTNTTDGKSSMEFADDFYDANGYGYGDDYDGVLFLINMEERELWISTCGKGAAVVTDYGIEEILDRVFDNASNGNYASVFLTFADTCDEFAKMYEEGNPYDIYYPSEDEDGGYYDPYDNYVPGEKEPFDFAVNLVISVIIGFIIALIVTGIMKSKLKSVAAQYTAAGYSDPAGIKLTEQRDTFLYSNIVRTVIPKESSSGSGGHSGGSTMHSSSSGTSHGGGGRHF